MARRREQLEIFSLSFLDLIFCAMAGILVLYSIADSSADEEEAQILPTLIEVEFNDTVRESVVRVTLQNGTRYHVGTNIDGREWTFSKNPMIARLKLEDELKATRSLTVELVDFDWINGEDQMPFRIRIMSPTSGLAEGGGSLTEARLRHIYAF